MTALPAPAPPAHATASLAPGSTARDTTSAIPFPGSRPDPARPTALGARPVRLRDMPLGERPQERLEKLGAGSLSDTELLAMLLRSGSKERDVLEVASSLIQAAGSLNNLLRWKLEDYLQVSGIGRVKALQLLAVLEVAGRVLSREAREVQPLMGSPEAIFAIFHPLAAGLDVEKVWVACLNRRNRLIRHEAISSGTATGSLCHPREVFRPAIRAGATAIALVHNHPSGDPSPSSGDLKVTRCLAKAAETVEIAFLDHVIIGEPAHDPAGLGFYSFHESGVL